MHRVRRTRLSPARPIFAAMFALWLWSAARAQTSDRKLTTAQRTTHFLDGRRDGGAGALDAARRQHLDMLLEPRTSALSARWTAVGPMQVLSAGFGNVTGRVTAIAIDPADPSGNTIYLGTTGGGVWKSVNAAGPAGAVRFVPLTDTLPVFNAGAGSSAIASLSIGSLAMANGVVLAGTGDPNDATDSYYGAGILRSADGGSTWTLTQQSLDGVAGNHSFMGLSVAGIAFSTANPSLAVAAISQAAEGTLVNAPDAVNSVKGLYWSGDAGLTWHMSTIMDGSQTVQSPQPVGGNSGGNAAVSVVWNPVRQRFYAAVQFHGFYESTDGATWTRLAHQPGVGLTATACPANPGATGNASCPVFRAALAVEAISGDTFALTVDGANHDQGLYRDVCALSGSSCSSAAIAFGTMLNAGPLEVSKGDTSIAQADYNLALAASASGSDTILYVGTVDLYRCSLAAGCSLRNTTNAQNGCANPARVSPSQHALAALATAGGPLLYIGNDGGVWRSPDGANEQSAACSLDDASHFEDLNAGVGSLAEVASFSQSPTDVGTLLAGLGALGTAGTGTVTNSWPQLATGEGGTVAIDPFNPLLWYLSTGAGVDIARCSKGSNCAAADFATTVIGSAQVANDIAAIHAPWILDPGMDANLIVGTCRVWRGPTLGGALWSGANAISRPLGAASATGCSATFPVVRSLAAGGAIATGSNAQNAGSEVIYAGLAGVLDGGRTLGGHLFVTSAANIATNATVWTDATKSNVVNDPADAGLFNPGGFDVSSIAVDPHDATGSTVYATVMGFAGSGVRSPHVYGSTDAGAHWTNLSSNLPNAPANSIVVDPNDANTIYVALDTGVYVTTQVTNCASGNCWSVFGSLLPNAPVVELQAAASMPTGGGTLGELRAATYGRGIWQIPLLTATSPALPLMSLNPATVTYTAQPVGTASAYVTITVTNSGSAVLNVTSVTVNGDFNETDTCAGKAIAQSGTCTVQVRFLPSAPGQRNGLLTVYGNVAGGQATAALAGIGTQAASVVLNPVSLTFGTTNVGGSSAVQSITISNTGSNVSGIQAISIAGDYKIQNDTCGVSLGAGTGCTVSIAFSPTVSGSRSGTLTVVDDAGTQSASLVGTGTNPATDTLSPTTLTFSAQQLNTTSAVQQATLINVGDVALTLVAAQVTSGDFTVVNGCGSSLNAHASCGLSIAFVPKSVGAQTGLLTVSDQFRSQTVQLSGIGLAPPGVSLSPLNGLVFGAVGVGSSAAPQTVTLTNNGGVSLALASVNVSGDFFTVPGSNTCGSSVAPAAICTVQIGFTPSAAGARNGTVTFSDNAANSPQSLALSGTGVDFALAANGPVSLTVASGQTATYALLLTSAAGQTGTVTFTCSGVPAHSTCTVNPATAALGASTNVSVTVATGLLTADLRIPTTPWSERGVWLALLLPAGWIRWRRRRWPVRLAGLFAAMLLLGAGGCAAGRTVPANGTPGGPTAVTPSGSYPLVVAGSSAGLVRSVNLTLVVQ